MPTPDRTTLKTTIQALMALLRSNLAADPPTVTKPFRAVRDGEAGDVEYPRPFLAVRLTRARPIATVDGDKLFDVTLRMRIVTDVIGSDVHDALLDKCAAVEDYFDSIVDAGVVDGADGFDDRAWTFDYATGTQTGRVAAAECEQTFALKVQRGFNRAPA